MEKPFFSSLLRIVSVGAAEAARSLGCAWDDGGCLAVFRSSRVWRAVMGEDYRRDAYTTGYHWFVAQSPQLRGCPELFSPSFRSESAKKRRTRIQDGVPR
jgi:hypothetical protein